VSKLTEELTKLAALRESGVLTDAEFAAQKSHVLGGVARPDAIPPTALSPDLRDQGVITPAGFDARKARINVESGSTFGTPKPEAPRNRFSETKPVWAAAGLAAAATAALWVTGHFPDIGHHSSAAWQTSATVPSAAAPAASSVQVALANPPASPGSSPATQAPADGDLRGEEPVGETASAIAQAHAYGFKSYKSYRDSLPDPNHVSASAPAANAQPSSGHDVCATAWSICWNEAARVRNMAQQAQCTAQRSRCEQRLGN
jgi:hypothetical protein